MNRQHMRFVVIVVFSLLLFACGAEPPAVVAGTAEEVRITLAEFSIDASQTTFAPNKPYRFTIQNDGKVAHEWMILPEGDTEHEKALFEVTEEDLQPGATVTRDYTFPRAGKFEFACRLPGHYEAGQKLRINVN